MHRRARRASPNAIDIWALREEGHVVGNRPGEKLIVLHDNPDHRSISGNADPTERLSINEDIAFDGRYEAGENLQQGGLAASRGADNSNRFAGLDLEADAVENPRLIVSITIANIAHLDRGGNEVRVGHDFGVARLRGRKSDIGKPLRVQPQHRQVDNLVD